MATLGLGDFVAISGLKDAKVEGRLGAAVLGGRGWGEGGEDG